MGNLARMSSIEDGRACAEDRTLYRTAQGRQKETYLGIPYSLVSRLYESSLAEVHVLLYVWQRTGGWKDYHSHPQPVRITFAEWTGGRPGYAQDTGAHLCKQEVATARDALVARGWLYEEWETPHERGPRRYAPIAPDNPGIGAYQREDGCWEVLLLTDEGPQPYQIPASVLQHRTVGVSVLQHRTGSFLCCRTGCPTTQDSPVLQHRKEKSRRGFPGQGRTQPITNVLTNSSIKEELAKRAADAASTPGDIFKEVEVGKIQTPPTPPQQGSADFACNDMKKPPSTAEFISKPSLFPVVEMPAPAPAGEPAVSPKRSHKKGAPKEPKPRPPNPMFEVWKQHMPFPPGSAREIESICTGLAELSNPAKTEGKPVTPEELPGLMYQVMSWVDRKTGQQYTPTPRLIAEWLGRLREDIIENPAPKVRAWQAGYLPSSEEGCEVDGDQAEEHAEVQPDQRAGIPSPDTGDPSTNLVTDPEWLAQLSRFVPDVERNDGRKTRDVHMLWGFVRDALRPGLNTARRQHLEALVPAWNPTNPRELVLLGATSYTIRFANMAMLREIDDLIRKLLGRFFDHARLAFVRQAVIDHIEGQAGFGRQYAGEARIGSPGEQRKRGDQQQKGRYP